MSLVKQKMTTLSVIQIVNDTSCYHGLETIPILNLFCIHSYHTVKYLSSKGCVIAFSPPCFISEFLGTLDYLCYISSKMSGLPM